MKVSLKRLELQGLYEALTRNLKNFKGAKLSYAVVKNLRLMKEELDAIQDTRIALCEAHSKKDLEGEPEIVDEKYVIQEQEMFDAELTELFSKDTELELHSVKQEDLNDDMTGDLMVLIESFVE